MNWQPIETAPKDGTEVWAFNGEQARMKWISGPGYGLWAWSDELLSDADPSPDQPSHWMPLPAAPEAKQAEPIEGLFGGDGENQAVRMFLILYNKGAITVGGMRKYMQTAGWPQMPEWVDEHSAPDLLSSRLAQRWLRHLFAMETPEIAAALDRMDALLDPANGLLTVPSASATVIASRADMALIRAALAAKESP